MSHSTPDAEPRHLKESLRALEEAFGDSTYCCPLYCASRLPANSLQSTSARAVRPVSAPYLPSTMRPRLTTPLPSY